MSLEDQIPPAVKKEPISALLLIAVVGALVLFGLSMHDKSKAPAPVVPAPAPAPAPEPKPCNPCNPYGPCRPNAPCPYGGGFAPGLVNFDYDCPWCGKRVAFRSPGNFRMIGQRCGRCNNRVAFYPASDAGLVSKAAAPVSEKTTPTK